MTKDEQVNVVVAVLEKVVPRFEPLIRNEVARWLEQHGAEMMERFVSRELTQSAVAHVAAKERDRIERKLAAAVKP